MQATRVRCGPPSRWRAKKASRSEHTPVSRTSWALAGGRCEVTPAEVEDLVLYQVSALAGMASAQGVRLQHVKAHGALYNMACRDRALADAIARAVAAFDRSLSCSASQLGIAARRRGRGLRVAAEVFADRAYDPDGALTSRAKPGSVIHDTPTVVERAIKMVREKKVIAVDGSVIALQADTICLHGDTPGAADHARAVGRDWKRPAFGCRVCRSETLVEHRALKRLRAALLTARRPKVAANLAPPSYCSTSATENRLATQPVNPNSVPRVFEPVSAINCLRVAPRTRN